MNFQIDENDLIVGEKIGAPIAVHTLPFPHGTLKRYIFSDFVLIILPALQNLANITVEFSYSAPGPCNSLHFLSFSNCVKYINFVSDKLTKTQTKYQHKAVFNQGNLL